MKKSELTTLIRECLREVLHEEWGDDGMMSTINVREDEKPDETDSTYEKDDPQRTDR